MKTFQRFLLLGFLFLASVAPAFAQQFSILPVTSKSQEDCKGVLDQYEKEGKVLMTADSSLAGKAKAADDAASGAFLKATDAQSKADEAQKAVEAAKAADAKAQALADKLKQCSPDPLKQGADGYPSECTTMSPDEMQKAKDAAVSSPADSIVAQDKAIKAGNDAKKAQDDAQSLLDTASKADQAAADNDQRANVLGCAIKTGRINLAMIPYFITYIVNFMLGLSGIICVLFIVIGGYHYVLGGLTDDKEKGKNTIKHALMGMGLALLAWTIVTVIMRAVTG